MVNKATDIVRVARDHKICMLIYKFAYKLKVLLMNLIAFMFDLNGHVGHLKFASNWLCHDTWEESGKSEYILIINKRPSFRIIHRSTNGQKRSLLFFKFVSFSTST